MTSFVLWRTSLRPTARRSRAGAGVRAGEAGGRAAGSASVCCSSGAGGARLGALSCPHKAGVAPRSVRNRHPGVGGEAQEQVNWWERKIHLIEPSRNTWKLQRVNR